MNRKDFIKEARQIIAEELVRNHLSTYTVELPKYLGNTDIILKSPDGLAKTYDLKPSYENYKVKNVSINFALRNKLEEIIGDAKKMNEFNKYYEEQMKSYDLNSNDNLEKEDIE